MGKRKRFIINVLYYAVVVALIFVGFKLLFGKLFPFTLAVLLSVVTHRFSKKVANKTNTKQKSVAVACVLTCYLVFASTLFLICYFLYVQLWDMVGKIPEYTLYLNTVFENLSSSFFDITKKLPENISVVVEQMPSNLVASFSEWAVSYLTNFATAVASGVPAFLISVMFTVIASAYIAGDYENIKKAVEENVTILTMKKILKLKQIVFGNVAGVIKGYGILMLITFFQIFLGLFVIGYPYAFTTAVIISLIDILPVLGTGTILIPWAVVSLLGGNVFMGVSIGTIYLVVSVVRNIIEPRIIGKKLGASPLLMLFAVFCGIQFFGFSGLFLAPLTMILIKHSFFEQPNEL